MGQWKKCIRREEESIGVKEKKYIKKGEIDSIAARASKLIKKMKEDYDAAELIRSMRNRTYDICKKHKI